jgi:SET domain-containing protein 6
LELRSFRVGCRAQLKRIRLAGTCKSTSPTGISHAKLTTSQESQFDPEDLEESFIIERDSGEPDSEGRLVHDAKLREISAELEEQLKSLFKAAKKSKPEAFTDKRKREEVSNAAIGKALVAKMGQYSTSIQEDKALLKKGGLAKRHKMAIEVRLRERMLLQEAIALVEESTVADDEDGRAAKKPRTKA